MKRGAILPGSVLASEALGVAGSVSSRPAHRPRPGYVLGDPGRPAEVPTLLLVDFDSSGSVVSPLGTDPMSNRFAEVAYAFEVVARRGSARELGAVVHFDLTGSDVDPMPITRRGLKALQAGLRVPPDGAGTSNLGPSLDRAIGIAEAYPDYEATLVVLSDFLLTDPEPGPVLSRLAAFPGHVHAVVLGVRLPAGVLDQRITVTHVGRDDPPGAVAKALFASLTTYRLRGRSGSTRTDDAGPRSSWIPQRLARRRSGGAEGERYQRRRPIDSLDDSDE